MTPLEEVLLLQKKHSILQAPTRAPPVRVMSATKSTLDITLQNNTSSSSVWAYITGLDLGRDNAVFILRSDGVTPYHPTSPSRTLSPLAQDCHIRLGAPGTARTATVPRLAGGRIWFCIDSQLTFFLNPGPALVEPSVMNPSDANYNNVWSFAEFTFNSAELFANITYVDFVSIPISLTLASIARPSSAPQYVPGIPPSGLDNVYSALLDQHARDGADWDKLVIRSPSGNPLRALSPNSAIKLYQSSSPPLFHSYFNPYVSAVWSQYRSTPLNVNTQAQWGVLAGSVVNNTLVFPGVGAFLPPSSADIFSCELPTTTTSPVMGNVAARLAAALNRSTLLANANQPDGEDIGRYYRENITNHYARIVHEASVDGKGYAFPYDDVAPREEENVAGVVADGDPGLFVVAVGGGRGWPMDVSRKRAEGDANEEKQTSDLEKGGSRLILPRTRREASSLVSATTAAAVQRRVEDLVERASESRVAVVRGVAPVLQGLGWAVLALLSLSARSLVSRIVLGLVVLMGGFLVVVFGQHGGERL